MQVVSEVAAGLREGWLFVEFSRLRQLMLVYARRLKQGTCHKTPASTVKDILEEMDIINKSQPTVSADPDTIVSHEIRGIAETIRGVIDWSHRLDEGLEREIKGTGMDPAQFGQSLQSIIATWGNRSDLDSAKECIRRVARYMWSAEKHHNGLLTKKLEELAAVVERMAEGDRL